MAFDPSAITRVTHETLGGDLVLSWESPAPEGTGFQIYVNGGLVWRGRARRAVIPAPEAKSRVVVGAVGPGEESTDFSGSLSPAIKDRASLSWLGGTFLDATGDVQGFRVYGETKSGAGIDYARPLADIPAYAGGEPLDGYGQGGFGQGGFGRAAATYRWTSPPLSSGVWSFAVRSYDAAGNEAPPETVVIPIAAPPKPPAMGSDRRRLRYVYDQATGRATLRWLASPE